VSSGRTVTPADLAAWWQRLPPRRGAVPVLAVDGRSGSGKSRLAASLAALVPAAAVVAMDDVYPGWDGLAASVPLLVEHVLEPVTAGRPAAVPRWAWVSGRPAPPRPLPAAPLLLVEGVGCAARACAPFLSGVVWVAAAAELRKRRALARDGDGYAPHWDRWAAQEEAYLEAERPDVRADLVLDGGGDGPALAVLADRRGARLGSVGVCPPNASP
jgi:hypothetical protein